MEKPQTVAHEPRFDALLWEPIVTDYGPYGGLLDRIEVPGGWLYRHSRTGGTVMAFVPRPPLVFGVNPDRSRQSVDPHFGVDTPSLAPQPVGTPGTLSPEAGQPVRFDVWPPPVDTKKTD